MKPTNYREQEMQVGMMPKAKDLAGQRFERLFVTSRAENDNNGRAMWSCICDCGNVVTVKSTNLVGGRTRSCGCIRANDLTGKRFGRLFVLKRTENRRTAGGRSQIQYQCKCDCGNVIIVIGEALRSGNTKSCGCYEHDVHINMSTTHGKTGIRLYRIWQGMKQRCYYPQNTHYKHYGGRGIIICDEWKNDFQAFYDWAMSHGYSDSLTIDRINNDGNYEPSNCRWATNSEQQLNKRRKEKAL